MQYARSIKRHLPKVFLLTAFAVSAAIAQTPSIPKGKTVKPSKEFIGEESKPYKYWPVDLPIWNEFNDYLEKKNNFSALSLASKQVAGFGESSAEGAEGRMMAGIALEKLGLVQASIFVLTDVAQGSIGSNPGTKALQLLGDMTKKYDYDKTALSHLLVANDFASLHPEVLSFVSYHKTLYNLRYGFDRWAKIHMGRIKEGTYWDHLFKYWSAVSEVANGRVDNAKTMFVMIRDSENLDENLKEKVLLQLARLDFEEGNFKESFESYSELKQRGLRDWGRLQLERAWVKYYMRDYSKAMGILTSLRAPIFYPSVDFERYILEMIIYKELCHYEAVEDVAKRFRSRFKKSLNAIKRRKPLRETKELFSMAVLNKDVQSVANLVDAVNKEARILGEYGWDYFFVDPVLEHYGLLEKRLRIELDRILEERTRVVANELLDAEEQVTFIEYTARLDKLRVVRQGEERDYISEKVPYLTFSSIFWPVSLNPSTSEFWTGELDKYKMLISSRCGQTNNAIPIDDSDEENLEEEFK